LGARVHTTEEAAKIVDVFQAHGHNGIDTARLYGNGTTEEILAELDWQKRGITMDTKLYPNGAIPSRALLGGLHSTPTRPLMSVEVSKTVSEHSDVRR
jgi:aflatoxin B1 aldehyde reductase